MTTEPPQHIGLFVPGLMDGASGLALEHLRRPELADIQAIAADPKRSTNERVVAFARLREQEVGDTAFVRARNLERALGFGQLYLKFEGGNPTGSQKDRIAFAQVADALKRGYDSVTVATCGNFGAALSFAGSLAGLRCVVCIPEAYHTKRIDEMRAMGATIVRTPGDYERAVDISRSMADTDGLYDANPGGANSRLQVEAYSAIATEIATATGRLFGDVPQAVAVPVSNGTTLVGVAAGFEWLLADGAIARSPKVVAGSSFRNNPIVAAYRSGLTQCVDLDPDAIRETQVNEPLVNWRALDGDEALWAVRRSGGWASEHGDRRLNELSKMIRRQEGLHVLPASTASVAALAAGHRESPFEEGIYVAVLTGRRE